MANLKQYIQFQRPMSAMLTALALPAAFGVYNFGWRVLAAVAFSCLVCWAVEYLFTRQDGKPATLSALVTGTLLALVCPPNVPFWMLGVGGVFAMVFGKMVFGGFGKNVFNPAMVGRCFLYVCFPIALTGTWFGPVQGPAGGLASWTTDAPVHEVDHPSDAVSGATLLTAAKKLNGMALGREEALEGDGLPDPAATYRSFPVARAITGRISGSMGETSAIAILLAFAFLLYKKVLQTPLWLGPVIGMALGLGVLTLAGASALPYGRSLLLNVVGGGTLFACVFMTTEPVSAPMNRRAKWIYAILIGIFASIIRSLSVFNAGLMFSILLANMFGPILDYACNEFDAWQKRRARAAEPAAGGTA